MIVRDITPSDEPSVDAVEVLLPRSRRPESRRPSVGEVPMPGPLNLPERKDADGEWHRGPRRLLLVRLHYLHAEDDRDLVWEPGKEHEVLLGR